MAKALSASSSLSEGFCGGSVQVPTRLSIDGIQGGSTGRGAPDEELVCLVSAWIPGWGLEVIEAVGMGRDATTLRASTAAQGPLGSGSVARKHTMRAGAKRIFRDRISGAYAERTLPSVGACYPCCYPHGTLPSAGACYPPVGAVRRTIRARARAKSSEGSMQCRRGPSCGGVIRA